MEKDPRWTCKKKDVAIVFGISVQALDAWIARGCPVESRASNGRIQSFYLPDVCAWRLQQFEASSPLDGGGDDQQLNPVAEHARKEKEMADKLAMENAVTRGELLPVESVAALWVGVLTDCKKKFLALPSKLAPRVIGKSREQARGILESAIHDALRGLAETRYVEGEGNDAPAKTDRKPVGRRRKKAKSRSERGAGAVGN